MTAYLVILPFILVHSAERLHNFIDHINDNKTRDKGDGVACPSAAPIVAIAVIVVFSSGVFRRGIIFNPAACFIAGAAFVTALFRCAVFCFAFSAHDAILAQQREPANKSKD